MISGASSAKDVAVFVLPALAAIAVYSNALHPTAFRDDAVILLDERVRSGDWRALALGDYWPPNAAFTDRLYRPLTSLSFALQREYGPVGLRVVNVLLHAAASVLVAAWAKRQWRSRAAGATAGLLFAVHPIHTEALNLVVGRADVAATFLALAAVLTTARRPVLGATLFGAALLCKEQVLLLPAMVLLFDRRSAALWMLVVAFYLGLRWTALGAMMRDPATIAVADNVLAHPSVDLPPNGSTSLARYGTPVALVGKAAGLMLWPTPLSNDYSYAAITPVRSLLEPRLLLGAVVFAGAIAGVVVFRRGPIGVGLAWTLATYALVTNGPIIIGTIFGERLLYLPSAGLCMIAGGLALVRPRAAIAAVVVVLSLAGAGRVVQRNADWSSLAALVRADFPKQPNSSRLLTMYAALELRAGRPRAALEYSRRAAEICPTFPVDHVMGLSLYRLGEERAALEAFERCIQRGGAFDEESLVAAADLLVKYGDAPQAIRELERQLQRNPTWAAARERLRMLIRGRR